MERFGNSRVVYCEGGRKPVAEKIEILKKKKKNLVLCDVHMVLEKETLNLLLRKVAVVDGVM